MPLIPPPPPLHSFLTGNPQFLRNSNNSNNNNLELTFCSWAQNPEVQRSCFFAGICINDPPIECVYSKVEPILQVGPTCGLVAASMLMQGQPSAGDLLKQAIELDYSNNGEMFSAKWLLTIINQNLPVSSACSKTPANLKAYLDDGNLSSEYIKEKLRNHCMILVPYDSDKANHSPCNNNGHKAHWCLIVGYLIDDSDNWFVFVRHGKTKSMGLFSLRKLSDSNENLIEFAQPVLHPNEDFMLPAGGIGGANGLRNKSIIIDGLDNEIIRII